MKGLSFARDRREKSLRGLADDSILLEEILDELDRLAATEGETQAAPSTGRSRRRRPGNRR